MLDQKKSFRMVRSLPGTLSPKSSTATSTLSMIILEPPPTLMPIVPDLVTITVS